VVSGLPTESFLYLGYLPRKTTDRCRLLRRIKDLPYTLLFLETPHRLLASLSDLEAELGDRQISLARELTKVHEEVWRGAISSAHNYYSEREPRGEFILVIAGAAIQTREKWTEERLKAAIRKGLKMGEPPSSLARRLAKESGWERRKVYDRIKGK